MIRVLHCPDIIGGNPSALARAERELGLDSRAVAFRNTVFSYPIDETLLKASDGMAAYASAMVRLFFKAMRYDFIHYNFGRTIFPTHSMMLPKNGFLSSIGRPILALLRMIDLPILHALGKGIAVTFQGDDARQGDYSLENFEISIAESVGTDYYTPESDIGKRRNIVAFDRYADLIYYTNPDLAQVLPRRAKFMPYAHVDIRSWNVVPSRNRVRPLVVHAPSHRGVKGTNVVLQTVELLQKEGVDFDLQVVEGLPNHEARKIYEEADLLIDQLYAGWYGGLAVELMALGKPVICYIREADLKFIPKKMREDLPIINATTETLRHVLKEWLTVRKDELLPLGARSRTYVESWHDPLKIAAQLCDDYKSVMAM